MNTRDVSLHPRIENTRNKIITEPVVQFTLIQIKERFDKTIEDIQGQFVLADSLIQNEMADSGKDIYRSQIVFLESALDFYIHEISKYGIVSIFTDKWQKTDRYNNCKVPMEVLEKGIRNSKTTEWLSEYFNQRFSSEVYLSVETMKDQLNMLGLSFESIVKEAYQPFFEVNQAYTEGKSIIKELFERRNQIAHQSDRKHTNAERNDISKEYVQNCILNVKQLVETIHKYASNSSQE